MKAADTKLQKIALRKKMRLQREALSKSNRDTESQHLCHQLLELLEQKKPQVIHSFLPMGSEIDIFPFLEKVLELGITVVAPKTLKYRKLEHLVLASLDQLEEGVFGTRHPNNNEIYSGTYDLIIVPGLAFDEKGNRLGYGGGYYDNFLTQHPEAFKVGVAYPFQLFREIPKEDHDARLDLIFTGDN